MNKILLLFLLPTSVFATPQSKRINAATNSIPQSFSTAAGSLLLSEMKNPIGLTLDNQTGTEIEVNCSHAGNDVPNSSEGGSLWIKANTQQVLNGFTGLSQDCYARSMGGTISSGIFILTVHDQYQ